ncbi:MAG TPA: MFS transporter [Actinomycetota bacterium]|nr:MFS transporter [Actinomycetota bacterium]
MIEHREGCHLLEGTNQTASRATAKEWVGLAVISIACLLYVMDLSVLYLAVPSLTRDLEPTSAQLLWITDIYGFLVAGFLITMGTLGDRIGRRRVLLTGAAAFGAASLLAAFSTSAEMLIGSRALLGVAGATVAPSTLSLIRNMFHDERERTRAISLWGTAFAAGGAVGPLVGGLLLEHFWWGSVFLINVPVMALLLVLGPRLLPEFKDASAGRLDLTSAAMSLAAVLAVIYGLKQIAQDEFGASAAATVVAGLVVGAAFVRRQKKLADPLIDLNLFRIPKFSVSVASNAMTGFIAFGTFLYTAQYLQLVLGLSPWEAGLWSLPSSVGVVFSSLMAPAVAKRVRPAAGVAGGLMVSALGLLILTQVNATSGLPLVVTGSIVFALGMGPIFILATDLIMGTAPPEKAGAASAISETGAEFGGAVGIAILGSIGTAVYRDRLIEAVPAEVPTAAANAARDTLGGALAAAQELPAGPAAELVDAARSAFTEGLHIATMTGAVIAVAIAILVYAKLRNVPGSYQSGDTGDSPGDPDAGSYEESTGLVVGSSEPPSGSTVTAAPSKSSSERVDSTITTASVASNVMSGTGTPSSMSHS